MRGECRRKNGLRRALALLALLALAETPAAESSADQSLGAFRAWSSKNVQADWAGGVLTLKNESPALYGAVYIPLAVNGSYDRYEISVRRVAGGAKALGYFTLAREVRGETLAYHAYGMEFVRPGSYVFADEKGIIKNYYRPELPAGPVAMESRLQKYAALGERLTAAKLSRLPAGERRRAEKIIAESEYQTALRLAGALAEDADAAAEYDLWETADWEALRRAKEKDAALRLFLEEQMPEAGWRIWEKREQAEPKLKAFRLNEAAEESWRLQESLQAKDAPFHAFLTRELPEKETDQWLERGAAEPEAFAQIRRDADAYEQELLAEAGRRHPGLAAKLRQWKAEEARRIRRERRTDRELNRKMHEQEQSFHQGERRRALRDEAFRR